METLLEISETEREPLSCLSQGSYFKYSKTCVKWTLSKRSQIGFQDQLSLNAGQKYCRMLQRELSAILLTFNKLPFVIKIFFLSIFEWPFYTGFTVLIIDYDRAHTGKVIQIQAQLIYSPTYLKELILLEIMS